MEVVFYVISLIFQIAGALLLIIRWCRKIDEVLKQEYFAVIGNIGKKVENDIEIVVDEKRIGDIMRNVYMNRTAFIYILGGYVLSVFGTPISNKITGAVIIFLVSIAFTLLSNSALKKIAKKKSESVYYKDLVKNNVPNGATVMVLMKDSK